MRFSSARIDSARLYRALVLLAVATAVVMWVGCGGSSSGSGSGTINTVVGSNITGFSGDGGAATLARLNAPSGVAVDSSGNIYVADFNNSRIRKVDSKGTISTFAGNGIASFGGDGGAATSAMLNGPISVAVDGSGNLYIADQLNNAVRKVASNGTITTIAGTTVAGYNGDNIAATTAQLNLPSGVAVDGSGNVYIADFGNQRIRKVSSTGTITTIAGTGVAGFAGDNGAATAAQMSAPIAVALDKSGNLVICDQGNNRIRQVTSSGTISTIAGSGVAGSTGDNGSATAAQLANPSGVAVDGSGNVYISDTVNQRVRKVSGGNIFNAAGIGTAGFLGDGSAATKAELNGPFGLAVDASGNLYIADSRNQVVRKVSF